MSHIKVLGIDLAKNVFQIHGTDSKGKCILTKRLTRAKLVEFLANLTPCLIGIEACSSSNHWARTMIKMGHTVKIIAPQYVKPFVKTNKNDKNDAEGIAIAVTRPDMKFVPIKNLEHQDLQLIHRARQLLVKQRTALANQIRGFLAEYGVILSVGISNISKIPKILDEQQNILTSVCCEIINKIYEQFKNCDEQIKNYDKRLKQIVANNPQCQELIKIPGIGPMIATAAISTVGNASEFKNGREVAAWLGLVPKQYSSGNKIRLSGISHRGDCYLRTLLIHGARSVVEKCDSKKNKQSIWLLEKKNKKGKNLAAVALANKNARIIGAILKSGECYRGAVA